MTPKILTAAITLGTAFLGAWIKDLKSYLAARKENPAVKYDWLVMLVALLESLYAGIPGASVVAIATPEG